MTARDRVVLVTGATGSVGRAVARAFAADGDRLGLGGTDRGRLEASAAELGLSADRWVAAVGDLRDAAAAEAAVRSVVERFGQVDVVVHVVGGYKGGTPVAELDPADAREMLEQHVLTTINVARAAVPGMVERGWGRVVAVSATAAEGGARQAAYGAAKAGQEVVLRSLAREVASTGVTVNVLVLRAVDAKHEREREPSPKTAAWTTPEEVAAVIRFLCSDEAAPINGARIPLHGRG